MSEKQQMKEFEIVRANSNPVRSNANNRRRRREMKKKKKKSP